MSRLLRTRVVQRRFWRWAEYLAFTNACGEAHLRRGPLYEYGGKSGWYEVWTAIKRREAAS